MKIKDLRRVICVFLAAIMLLPVMSAVPMETKAATKVVDITIDMVKRKYRESASFLQLCNDYRSSLDLPAWEMDTELFDLAMKKAAELSIYTDENNLDGTNFLSSTTQSRGMLIGYAISNNSALLESFKSEPVYSSNLTSRTFNAAGVGVAEVNRLKYIVVFLAKKTVTPVDSSVLTQVNTTISQPTRCISDYLTECSMNFKDNDQIVCGGNAALRMVIHNQKFDEAYAYISGANTTITSSDTSVFRPNGDGTITGLKPGSATITMKLNGAPEITASATIKAVAKSFAGCTISKIPDQYYTGNAITPSVSITSSEGVSLVIGKDYTLSYVNNIEVGSAVVKITGIGAYSGATGTQNFNIVNEPNSFSVALKSNAAAIELGQSATLIATPANAATPVKYKFEAAPQGTSSFSVIRSESTESTCSYKPATAGSYNIRVTAVDAKNRTATSNISMEVSTPISITLGLSSTSLTLGNSVTITAKATGGSSPYKFAYYVLEPGKSAYTALASFGSLQTLTYKPESNGTYTVRVDVKGSNDIVATTTKSFNVGTVTPTNPLTNNSTLSATTTSVGVPVTLTGSASGGTSPYKYAFYYKKSGTSSWTTIGTAFSTATSASFKPTEAATYDLKVTVKDNTSATKDKTFTLTAKNTLVNNSTLSATSTSVGVPVTLTGSASGGTSPYKYAFYYKKSGSSSWTTIGTAFSTATSASFKPTEAATYDLKVTVKDSASMTSDKTFTITSNSPLTNNSTVSTTKATVGTAVTLTGKATGGTSPYKYAFYYKKSADSSWTTIGTAFSTATTASFKPDAVGTYNVKITVKDNASKTVDKTYTVQTASALVNNSVLSSTKRPAGEKITITGKASGGKSPYKYAFYYKRQENSSWKAIGTEYGTDTTAAFAPETAGVFDIKVNVKDSWGKVTAKKLTYTAVEPLVNNYNISANKIGVNNSVSITGSASGGTGSYKYAFYYKLKSASSYTVIGTEFSSTRSASFKPTAKGEYLIKISVKDSMGTVKSKALALSVNDLVNKSKLEYSMVGLGTAFTVKGNASGGTSPYKYAFYYKKEADTAYTTIGTPYGTNLSAAFKPTEKGVYKIKVCSKDKNGYVSTSVLTGTVTDLANKSTSDYTKVGINNTVTFKGNASGGTAPYKYAFYYKRSTNTVWNTLGTEFGSSTTAKLTPTAAATYNVRIVVKDSKGAVSNRGFTITTTDLANKSTVSSASIKANTRLTITGNASGGSKKGYKYTYYYKRSTNTNWNTIGTANTTETTASFKPTAAAVYNVKVVVKDSAGTVAVKTMNVKVT